MPCASIYNIARQLAILSLYKINIEYFLYKTVLNFVNQVFNENQVIVMLKSAAGGSYICRKQ